MEKNFEKEAIDLFASQYSMTPSEYGVPAIDFCEIQKEFVYGQNAECVDAYKKAQIYTRRIGLCLPWTFIVTVFAVLYIFFEKNHDHWIIALGLIVLAAILFFIGQWWAKLLQFEHRYLGKVIRLHK